MQWSKLKIAVYASSVRLSHLVVSLRMCAVYNFLVLERMASIKNWGKSNESSACLLVNIPLMSVTGTNVCCPFSVDFFNPSLFTGPMDGFWISLALAHYAGHVIGLPLSF